MFCKNCGTPLADEDAFCPNCGTAVTIRPNSTNKIMPPSQTDQVPPPPQVNVAPPPQINVAPPPQAAYAAGAAAAGTAKKLSGGLIAGISIGAVALVGAAVAAVLIFTHPGDEDEGSRRSKDKKSSGITAGEEEVTEEGGEEGAGESGTGSVAEEERVTDLVLHLMDANVDDEGIAGVTLTLYEGADAGGTSYAVTSTDNSGTALFEALPEGEYTLICDKDGYVRDKEQISVSSTQNEISRRLLHEFEAPFAYVMLEWEGDRDMDLVLYNDSTMEYVREYAPVDRSGNFLFSDNSGDKGYELACIRECDAPFEQDVFVLDYDAVNGSSSAGDFTVTVYTAAGIAYRKAVDTAESPAFRAGGFNGGSFTGADRFESGEEEWMTVDKRDEASVHNLELTLLGKKVELLNGSSGLANDELELQSVEFEPGVRNMADHWDSSLFYYLEDVDPGSSADGKINDYILTRRRALNTTTGNEMEFEIYRNPDNNKVNKIVSIEYYPDHLGIFDYYFDNQGKVNMIFARTDMNYRPIQPNMTLAGDYYFLANDTVTRRRIIRKKGNRTEITDYVTGMDNASDGFNTIEYDNMTDAQKQGFDTEELVGVNSAYKIYRFVNSSEASCAITGYIYDKDGNVRPGADVVLSCDDRDLYSVRTDSEGGYRIYVAAEERQYDLDLSYSGCESVRVYDVEVEPSALEVYEDSAYLVPASDTVTNVTMDVTDALNFNPNGEGMLRIANATLYIRKGMNNRKGDVVATVYTDANGYAYVPLSPGMYTVEVEKEGYDNFFMNIHVYEGLSTVYLSTSPKLAEGEVRIQLTWGQTPSDLDSHLFAPYTSRGEQHIWYSNKTISTGENLDVDDTSSYGPETITIPALRDGEYKYYVVDYTNSNRNNFSYEMSYSGATVRVYTSHGLTNTWHVPQGMQGIIWEVFEMRNGRIIPINRYYTYNNDQDWYAH
ncbi:MAG: zinc-ribbon domain-containing protein [Lachnospiraceae bacterium]|nr:zinc-ribbon domain-containing protein [Lachnospiraceae bacterium]